MFENSEVTGPVDLTIDGNLYSNVALPYQTKIKRGFKPSTVKAEAKGYEPCTISIAKKFNAVSVANVTNMIAWGIDAATGAMMKPEHKSYYLPLKRTNYVESNPTERVTRDNPGGTSLEGTVVRWFFDSEPRGARIFWRVVSNAPQEVKNTNELYLGTIPYEETRSFNIQGLTYENSHNVQIEIKVTRQGYEDQIKRFNVRQAIDQQEISGFFDLVKKPGEND